MSLIFVLWFGIFARKATAGVPGKGQAFTRIKYRNIKSGRVVEMTMKATDSLEAANKAVRFARGGGVQAFIEAET